jgi:hypothetical protein
VTDAEQDDEEWVGSCSDFFHKGFTPRHGKGLSLRYKNQNAADQMHDVWALTGAHGGWWFLKYALAAKKRLDKLDAEGEFDSRDHSTGKLQRAVRHEFRVIKIETSQKTTVVTVDDVVEAMA